MDTALQSIIDIALQQGIWAALYIDRRLSRMYGAKILGEIKARL